MPNHIKNILKISGDNALIARIKEEIHGEKEHQFIDFDKINPIPKELDGTSSPAKIITQKDYDAQEERIATGVRTDMELSFGLSRGLTQELSDEYKKKFGSDNWYDWQCKNWGTKWNAYGQSMDDNGDIIFDTAWATPVPIIEALSKKYPEATFNVRYADEDFGHNVGEYTIKGGEVTESDIPDGGSPEAYVMASTIRNESGCIKENLDDIEETDYSKLEKYQKQMIEAAYALKLYNEKYPQVVMDRLLQIAIKNEDYEVADMLKKLVEE